MHRAEAVQRHDERRAAAGIRRNALSFLNLPLWLPSPPGSAVSACVGAGPVCLVFCLLSLYFTLIDISLHSFWEHLSCFLGAGGTFLCSEPSTS